MFERQLVDGADFACDSVMAEAIGAIGTDFRVNHGTMRAIFNAGDVGTGESEARGEFLRRRGNVDEIFQPVINNFHASVPARLQLSEIHVRRVLHGHAAILLMPEKEFAQCLHHRGEVRMRLLRHVRGAAQEPGEPVPVQRPVVRQRALEKLANEKKSFHVVTVGIGLAHSHIIRTVFHENVLVGSAEWGLLIAKVPYRDDPAFPP